MAKDKRKNTDKRPSQPQDAEQKRSFFSRFFEPVPDDEENGLFLDDAYDGLPPETEPDDAPDDYDEGEDAQDSVRSSYAATQEDAPPAPAPPYVSFQPTTQDFDRAINAATPPVSTEYVPLTSSYTPPWRQTGVPLPQEPVPDEPAVTIPQQDAFPPAPGIAEPIPPAFIPQGVPAQQDAFPPAPGTAEPAPSISAPQDAPAQEGAQYAQFGTPTSVFAPPPPGVRRDPPSDTLDDAAAQYFDPDEMPAETIRLFDDEDEPSDTARRRVETRMFRTGTGSTTRIHINETEESARARAQEEQSRQRDAKRQRDAHAERQNLRKKRQAMLKKLFGNIAFVLFFITAIVIALYYGFLLSDIVVVGNEKYSTDYIVNLSGLELGRHMLFCDLDEAELNIEEEPYLQVEQITYIFPSRIRIIVSERTEVAGIIGLEGNVIIDKNGYVLSISGSTDMTDLLQVTGISMTGFQLGQRLGEGNDFGTATLIQLIDKLEEYQLVNRIKSVDLTTPLAITMIADNGLRIHVGQATDLDTKMSSLSKLLPQFLTQNITTGTLYLSAKGGTVYSPANAGTNATPIEDATGLSTEGIGTDTPLSGGTTMVDEDGDGLDDVTGEPYVTPAPTPAPTPNLPGGTQDDFSG